MQAHRLSRRSLLALLALSALPLRAEDAPPYRVLDFDWR